MLASQTFDRILWISSPDDCIDVLIHTSKYHVLTGAMRGWAKVPNVRKI